mgnify:CR=1 FL=1
MVQTLEVEMKVVVGLVTLAHLLADKLAEVQAQQNQVLAELAVDDLLIKKAA